MPKPLSGPIKPTNSRQLSLIIVPTVLSALATLAVYLRFYARRLKKTNFLADDYLCLFALVSPPPPSYPMLKLLFCALTILRYWLGLAMRPV